MPDETTQYLRSIEQALKLGNATESTHRPALKALVELLRPAVAATNEPKRSACGAPDFSVARNGLTIGYIEAKDVGKSLDEEERSEQLKRYRTLLNLILTDYLEFRWYVDGNRRATARLAREGKAGKLIRDIQGRQAVVELLRSFLDHAPTDIATPSELAQHMARLTHEIRNVIIGAFERQMASGMLKDLRESFARTLLPDLNQPEKAGEFADMYAQTLAYGLFAARANHRGPKGSFKRLGAASEIPKTNPFLRRLFETITGSALDDEPYAGYVDDLVQLLAHADMGKILAEFGKRTKQEDPIVHFYETFLATYDPKLREMRGVYYTPEPVVSYIVRSVDYLLRERFGLSGGLADTSRVKYEQKMNDGQVRRAEAPKVLILDPACGTGTFLYSVVDHIRRQFMTQGNAGQWSGFVRQHLLPRLFGFELLMAPYAVAHLKLGMQLAAQDMTQAQRKTWAYNFSGDERVNVYLTNTLEEAERKVETLFGPFRIITDEAKAAARVKGEMPVLVVLGNPPYSGHSANRSWEVKNGKRQRTFIGELLQDYYQVDGKPLGERNPKWLQDDYVKFIRWGQWRIEQTGGGILAFITNHGYFDNPTFRGMRQQLMNAFTEIYLLDLHGSTKKKEKAPDGSKDENVFDIQQGVAIGIFVKEPGKKGLAKVRHAELWGLRAEKYKRLLAEQIQTTRWHDLGPHAPFYAFTPRDGDLMAEYHKFRRISDIVCLSSAGIVTARDSLTLGWSADEIWEKVKDFAGIPPEQAREKYALGEDVRDWKVHLAQADVKSSGPDRNKVLPILYRPLDERFTYYTGITRGFICMPRPEVMRHMLAGQNFGLITTRQTRDEWDVLATRTICGHKSCAAYDINSLFPLYLYPDPATNGELFPNGKGRHVNLKAEFIAEVEKKTGLGFIDDGTGDLKKTFGPEDVFHYIYAVFHSPTYRERYAEFLKIDFPRVPLTSDRRLFRKLCGLGAELTALHLLESPSLAKKITNFPEAGSLRVEKGFPKYYPPGEIAPGFSDPIDKGRVYINKEQYFNGVPSEVWELHVGGYQVCDKWLKDRRGRQLSFDDVEHYCKVVVALNDTIRLMGEIDDAITDWPIR